MLYLVGGAVPLAPAEPAARDLPLFPRKTTTPCETDGQMIERRRTGCHIPLDSLGIREEILHLEVWNTEVGMALTLG